jgi:hypothetical protein
VRERKGHCFKYLPLCEPEDSERLLPIFIATR